MTFGLYRQQVSQRKRQRNAAVLRVIGIGAWQLNHCVRIV